MGEPNPNVVNIQALSQFRNADVTRLNWDQLMWLIASAKPLVTEYALRGWKTPRWQDNRLQVREDALRDKLEPPG